MQVWRTLPLVFLQSDKQSFLFDVNPPPTLVLEIHSPSTKQDSSCCPKDSPNKDIKISLNIILSLYIIVKNKYLRFDSIKCLDF